MVISTYGNSSVYRTYSDKQDEKLRISKWITDYGNLVCKLYFI